MDYVKDLLKKAIGRLITFYRLSPWQPFRTLFLKTYLKYVEPRMYGGKRIVVAERNGVKYRLNLNDHQDMSIYYQGSFEPRTTAVFKKYVKSGMTVLDIGAHNGYHTLQLAKLVGEKGRVIAFEPDPEIFALLKENMALNDFNNIFPTECALSDITANEEKTSYFIGSLSEPTKTVITQVITLDEFARKNRLEAIDFIKLDTDGCECQILRGARGLINKFAPLMIIEFSRTAQIRYGNTLEGLIELLESYGYSFFSEKNLKPYDKKTLLKAVPFNININVLCKKINSRLRAGPCNFSLREKI